MKKYHDLVKITEKEVLALGRYPSNLSTACGVASLRLLWHLVKNDIKTGNFVYGSYQDMNHCWVECDGYILDVTRDQFHSFPHKKVLKKGNKNYTYDVCDDKGFVSNSFDKISEFVNSWDMYLFPM